MTLLEKASAAVLPPPVLVVEDLKLARESLVRILRRENYDVRAAETGESAVEEARSASPCVVLMDLDLGEGMDGIEAAEEIRRRNPYSSFLFVTAHGDNRAYRQRANAHHFENADWIDKPYSPASLLTRLREKHARLWAQALVGHLPPNVLALIGGSAGDASHEDREFMQLVEEIDGLYERLGQVERRKRKDPRTIRELAAVKKRIAQLEDREADEIEIRYKASLAVDAAEAKALLARASAVK